MTHHLVSHDNLSKFIDQNIVPCVLKFGAKWCGPCVRIAPEFDELAKRHAHINFVSIDVDKHRPLMRIHKVQSIPRFDIYKRGSLVKQIVGADMSAVEDAIKGML